MAVHDELLDEARSRTGLADFGPDSFREGLERLVRSIRDEATTLNDLGHYVVREKILSLLTQRLQIEDWYHRHPEIDDEPIIAPLIGLGLPRTGSTALAFLLGEDPATRSLRRWESAEPCPPPSTVTPPDPRIARANEEVGMQAAVTPRAAALVPSSADGPYECQDMMSLDFKAQLFQAFAHIPSYSKWLLYDADLTTTYDYERRVLKLLQWGTPARPWRLKCPTHLLFLPALDHAFPDARFVMTHRDAAEVVVSVADVYAEVGSMCNDGLDDHYLGALNMEHWSVGMERAIEFRDRGNDHRFYDIDFRSMQRDPVGEVRRLYDWLGEPVSPEFERGMQRWWREHAESREPTVHPPPERFGIDLDDVRVRFAEYTRRASEWTARPG
jgi:Sulfotransferase family